MTDMPARARDGQAASIIPNVRPTITLVDDVPEETCIFSPGLCEEWIGYVAPPFFFRANCTDEPAWAASRKLHIVRCQYIRILCNCVVNSRTCFSMAAHAA